MVLLPNFSRVPWLSFAMAGFLILIACGIGLAEDSAQSPARSVLLSGKPVKLDLKEVVQLVAANNRELKNAYLERQSDTYNLVAAEDTFTPHFSIQSSVRQNYADVLSDVFGKTETEGTESSVGSGVAARLKTGAELNLGLLYGDTRSDIDRDLRNIEVSTGTQTRAPEFKATLKQPLLRNAGIAVNTAGVEIARNEDEVSQLTLRASLNQTVTEAILAFRELNKTHRQIKIETAGLERSRGQYKKISRLIQMGRMAQLDLIQAEAEISSNNLKLIQAENAFETSQLNLNKLLDVDEDYRVIPVEDIVIQKTPLDLEEAFQTALSNRPDRLKAQQDLKSKELNLLTAKNNRLWDLDLQAGYNKKYADETVKDPVQLDDERRHEDWHVGLFLKHTFAEENRNRQYHQARIAVRQAEYTLKDIWENIRIEVKNSLRNIEMTYQAYVVAQKARELTERKLDVEMKKLETGRSSTFTVTTFKNDVTRSMTDEVSAAIDYLNALTQKDLVLGVTYQKWELSPKEQ
jgi:outer membrane protein TolC